MWALMRGWFPKSCNTSTAAEKRHFLWQLRGVLRLAVSAVLAQVALLLLPFLAPVMR